MQLKKITFSLFGFIVFLTFFSCSMSNSKQKEFGIDADYFIGLQFLEKNQIDKAISKFERCRKKGSYYCARKSAENLCEIGDVQQKNKAALYLVENFRDSDSILLAAKQFFSSKEINKIIEITENLDFAKEKNEIIKIRLEAMKIRDDSRYNDEIFKWFTTCPISNIHYKFYKENITSPNFDENEQNISPKEFVLFYRIQSYLRNYEYTYKNAHIILDYFETEQIPLLEQITSDIGKSYLYGSTDFIKNAQYFKAFANSYKNTNLEYYFWFYAGRFYSKAENYISQSKNCFTNAYNCANSNDQKDDAIWYLLELSKNYKTDDFLREISELAKKWCNRSSFDSFFESLVPSFFASGNWNIFYDIYTILDGYASDEIVSQYAYIYARLCQEKLAQGSIEDINQAFLRATKSGTSNYYKILSSYRLSLSQNDFEKLVSDSSIYKTEIIDNEAEIFLKGFANFGFPQSIYENYINLYKKGISKKTSIFLANFLKDCAKNDEKYYPQSLRIASRAALYSPFTKEELKLLYPQNFKDFVDESSKKYDFNPSIMYALIRSESFFDSQIESYAGAIGLTQLMETTGKEMAGRLKISDFDLKDSKTNIEFGTYYLNHLYGRTNNSILQAFFAYNAGLSRVRRWLQGSLYEFGKKDSIPEDLFLETVPFSETREYGRKLISAVVMYDFLYNDKNFTDSIQLLLK